jgi:hypothetical protein
MKLKKKCFLARDATSAFGRHHIEDFWRGSLRGRRGLGGMGGYVSPRASRTRYNSETETIFEDRQEEERAKQLEVMLQRQEEQKLLQQQQQQQQQVPLQQQQQVEDDEGEEKEEEGVRREEEGDAEKDEQEKVSEVGYKGKL